MDRKAWRGLIKSTLESIGLYSKEAEDLIMGTFAQESRFRYTRQLGGGPALGYGQMEPATFYDIIHNFLRYKPALLQKIMRVSGMEEPEAGALVENEELMICMTRAHYLRVKEPIPRDLDGQAEYYKKYYNTYKGKATAEDYKRHYMEYCL